MVEEHLEVLLHLDRIVLHLSNGKDSEFAVLPGAVLLQQERQQHQHAAVMYNPPDVDVPIDLLGGLGEEVDALRHHERHFRRVDCAHGLQEHLP